MKDFTKAFHEKDAYIINGEGRKIPIQFTVISKLDKDQVKYKMSFCASTEKQFKKKDGVSQAQAAPEWSFPIDRLENHTHQEITSTILTDAFENHFDSIPTNHQRWFSGDNFGSDLKDFYEKQHMFELFLNEVIQESDAAEDTQ